MSIGMNTRQWLQTANTLMLQAVKQLDDDAFALASTLPKWTNAHLVAHLHFNALAIGRLTAWARTGVETPMYSSPAQRAADIETGATLLPAELRSLLAASTHDLETSFDALTPKMWSNTVVTAQGRTVPASELPWMRFREVAVHGIDLNTGLTFADFPADAVQKLVEEIVAKRIGANEGAAMAAVLTGRPSAGPVLGPWL
jgi:maleylpyruvate isomerase